MSEMVKNKGYLKKGTAHYTASAQTTIGAVTAMTIFNTLLFNDSASIIKLSDTQIKLLAGRKYNLRASITADFSAASYCSFQFYNVTTSTYVGNASELIASTWSASNASSNPLSELEIVCSVDTIIEFRSTGIGSGTISTHPSISYCHVEEVEAYLPVSPTSYKRGTAMFMQSAPGSDISGSWVGTSLAELPMFNCTMFNDSDSISVFSTTRIILKAGKKYRLTGELVVTSTAQVWVMYRFYNQTSGLQIGLHGRATQDASYADIGSTFAEVIIAPTIDTTISLIITNSTITTLFQGSKVIVEEIEAYLPIVSSPYSSQNVNITQVAGGITTTPSVQVGAGIIESGSNTNGSYIKNSDGTLLCFGINIISQPTGMAYPSITFPMQFYHIAPMVTVSIAPTAHWSWVWFGLQAMWVDRFTFSTTNNGAVQNVSANWIAVGRWRA